MASENLTTEDEIHALLKIAQRKSDTVKELTLDCLKQYRREYTEVFRAHQRVVADQLLEMGTQDEESIERLKANLEVARLRLKERLQNLLTTAGEKSL
jgi:hypothetical protein